MKQQHVVQEESYPGAIKDMANNIGSALAEDRILQAHRIWKLPVRKRAPEPNRKTLDK